MSDVSISVIIGTYNRSDVLRGALESLMSQESGGTAYEVIVVDNNSTDDTRRTVEELRDKNGYDNLFYFFEAEQGVSYARNRGIAAARAPILAFTDDDIRPARDWVYAIGDAFRRFPQADCIGGRVLPEPATKFPDWLTKNYWTPLALLDLGDEPVELDVRNGPGLVGANLAVRASVFKDAGLFRPQLQRVKDGIGSLEDHELQLRFDAADKRLMYIPDVVVYAHVIEERLTRTYHRRWYHGHGHFYAVMRDEKFESSKIRLFDVPAHLYRRTLSNVAGWMKSKLTKKKQLEFQRELDLHFFWGFFRKRFADRRSILRLRQR
jgi:glycosyltransferase involved in cell wall biosynthesis